MLLVAAGASARDTVGVYRGWATFRDDDPTRCYALTAPSPLRRGAFAAVGWWPDRRVAGQVQIRFAQAVRPGSAILLTIDGRPFQLRGRGRDGWAPNRETDRAIVAAMRTGVTMAAAARDEAGRPLDDRYALSGAASALDAAAIACRSR